ncbi:histidine phosphatase family protein [Halomonas sp. GFAJ-1]|uniref:histidine phosphatase family protein n=1 Tax=Halomonas sp. GFAJ-1 TaxID=1118153 RepID=UPI00023A5E40|nr:histidine phosphatase family protein [Halomonas sp. GFAJ-1]AVI61954.1 histidine phosphatase family protein [Halomonas sp. GFAJ-1]EHK61132.1 phosphoglycerate mutase family protein [Halomonas sp. GFAJ-1]
MLTLRYLSFALLLGMLSMLPLTTHANTATWQALQEGGLVILMRHALAPGIGDPPAFKLEECDTQRNLSAEGRAQAVRVGQAFREREVPIDAVYSSRWCRALETAEQLALGDVEPTPWLDSFFRNPGEREALTQALRDNIMAWQGPGNLMLVTHQVNITALIGGVVRSGDMAVVRPEGQVLNVVGSLSSNGE